MFLLALTAGVTVQLPRMFCSTAAAAPGCPSIAEYCAACANRPNKINAASRPRSTPKGMRNAASPVSNPTTTRITRTPRPLPMMIGMAFGLDLRISPATARICFSRPAFDRFSAVSLVTAGSAAPAFLDMRAMLRSIRLSRPGQKPPGFGDFRVTPNRPAYAQIRLAGCQDLPGAYGGRNARMTGRCRLPHREAAMRLRPRRRNLVVWSSTAVAVGRSGGVSHPRGARPARMRRIRWWFRTGALLVVLGALRLARTARVRWEPVSLLVGALITAAGFAIPAVGWAFLLGLLVLIGTLLVGINGQRRQRGPVRRMDPTL